MNSARGISSQELSARIYDIYQDFNEDRVSFFPDSLLLKQELLGWMWEFPAAVLWPVTQEDGQLMAMAPWPSQL